MAAKPDKVLNIIRGKNLVGRATQEDVNALFDRIDALEMALEDVDMGKKFGDGGWREHVGLGEAA